MTEREMLDGCLKGDGASQRKLFELHSPRVYSLILRYVAQEDAADDVLQETFLRIFDSVSRFVWRGEGSLRAWIDRIAVNMALNYVRDNRKESLAAQQPVELLGDDEPYEPEPSMVDKIDSNTLMDFIAELPDGYRTVFNLYCIEGFSHKQIAEKLGINEKSSSSQLARAKALLARRIKDYLNEQYDE